MSPPQFIRGNPNHPPGRGVLVFRDGAKRRKPSCMSLYCYKKKHKRDGFSVGCMRIQQEDVCKPRRVPSPETRSASTLLLDLPHSRTVRNKAFVVYATRLWPSGTAAETKIEVLKSHGVTLRYG